MKDRTELEKIKNDTRRNTVGNVYKWVQVHRCACTTTHIATYKAFFPQMLQHSQTLFWSHIKQNSTLRKTLS
jgi:hypothetical protein